MKELGILAALVGSALALRPKRRSGALDFLTGSRGSFLDLSTIATVATAAFGASELFGRRGPSTTTRAPEIPDVPRSPSRSAAAAPPERALRDDGSELSPDMLRLVRLTIAAALCDGHFSPTEKQRLTADAKAAGIEKLVARELDAPRSLREICAGIADTRHVRDVYTLAFAVVRADEGVSAAERRWLEELARELGLDRDATAELERAAVEQIDRAARA
ncbi:MAG: tellurite resistance TerB family protein [Planctomycetes bacterium]|nr:tellurite resistance TerB family protein [Planctomycetota bacterium]